MSLSTSIAGAYSAQRSISVISDNIANIGSTAFKENQITFSDIFSSNALSDAKTKIGSGVISNSITKNFSNGSLAVTGLSTDIAITGGAFFVTAPKQDYLSDYAPRYENYFTRNGSFEIDLDGYLVTAEKYNVLNTDHLPIRLPTTTLSNVNATFSASPNIDLERSDIEILNQSKLKFSADDRTVSLNWTEGANEKFEPGEVFFKDGGVFYVPITDLDINKSAIKVGEISNQDSNSIELVFEEPVIKAPVKTLKMVDVLKTFDVEVQELVTKQVTTSQLVQVDKVQVSKEKVYLDDFSTQYADFSSEEWSAVNKRFYAGETLVNGFPSPPDPTYGNPTLKYEGKDTRYETYTNQPLYGTDHGLEVNSKNFIATVDNDGTGVELRLSDFSAGKFQTTRGPFFHSNNPVFLQGGTEVKFDWYTEGSRDAFDLFAYLRNTKTNEYTIAVNETGIGDLQPYGSVEDPPKMGQYSFFVPEDGEYDIVFVGGTWDASGYGGAGAVSKISNLTFEARDFEYQDVEQIVKVWEAQNVTQDVQVLETITKQETRLVSELQEVTVYEDIPLNLDPSLLANIRSKINGSKSGVVEGFEIGPVSLNYIFEPKQGVASQSNIQMDLLDVQYLGQETIVNQFDSLTINPEGEISVVGSLDGEKVVAKIGSLLFTNPVSSDDLKYIRSGYFSSENKWRSSNFGSISEVLGGSVVQGSLERSNVDLMEQLSDLIRKQVIFNSNSKAIQAYAEAYKKVQDIR